MARKIESNTYYTLTVFVNGRKEERKIKNCVNINGRWFRRRYYKDTAPDDEIGYEYEIIDLNNIFIKSWEKQPNQEDESA